MSDIPVAKGKRASYENFVAECPCCGKESIFNRASDLGTFEPIAGRGVSCLSQDCGKPFRIVGDSVNSAHEMLVFDCHELVQQKHYMNSILTLAQAYEVFFSLFHRVELLFRPFSADPSRDVDTLSRLSKKLEKKVRKHTFVPLRALFLRRILAGKRPANLREAEAAIKALPDHPKEPSLRELDAIPDDRLRKLAKTLKQTTIHELRNQVVHKAAYRPTRKEAESALKETRAILLPLTRQLRLHDYLSWYMRRP